MVLSTAALIGSALLKAGAAGISAAKQRDAQATRNALYDYLEDYANAQSQSTILDTPGGKALLKIANKNAADTQDSIDNRMVAGGATFENSLAARQANNENLDKLQMKLIESDEARREAWKREGLNAKRQRTADVSNSYLQQAQDWNAWGSAAAQSMLDLGSTDLLGGGSGSLAANAAAQHDAWTVPGAASSAQDPSGLRGVYRNKEGVLIGR